MSVTAPAPKRIELSLPALHPEQERILRESSRFNVIRAGRRFGKSTLGRHVLMNAALQMAPVAWVAPTYKRLTPQWREICATLNPVIARRSEEEKHIDLIGHGGEIDFWSCDGGGFPGEGRKYKLIVCDEVAMLGSDLERIWTRSLRPTLADLQGGAWFLSTSKAASSYFTQMYSWGQGERPEWKSWQMRTGDNPYILPSEIDAAKQDLPAAAFAQEFEGDAVSFSGSVFTNLEQAIVDAPLPEQYARCAQQRSWMTPSMDFFIGCDWAGAGRRAGGDFTTFVVMAKDGTICAIERFKADFALQRVRLAGLVSGFRPAAVLAEENSIGAPMLSALRASGISVQGWTATNATKHKAVEALALGFEEQRVKIHDIENRAVLLAELMAFEGTSLPNGMTRFAAPSGGHDDLVIALMLAYLASHRPRVGECAWSPI